MPTGWHQQDSIPSSSRHRVTAAAVRDHKHNQRLKEGEKMFQISETEWKCALTSILEELEKAQYLKMLEYLAIPKSQKSRRPKANMPQTIIEWYGVEDSISAVNKAVDQIPRRDRAVQDLLRPFVDKLKKGTKRKRETDAKSADKKQKQKPASDNLQSHDPDKERTIPSWRKTIQDLESTNKLDNKAIVGKVVQKSGLRTYVTQHQKKFFFYLALADETGVIKVMVYGKERFQEFSQEHFYSFRDVIVENSIVKVTRLSKISKTSAFDVPDDLDLKARLLLYFYKPVCSIAETGSCGDKTLVSVLGYATEFGPIESIKLKTKRRSKAKQDFTLEDKTGFIRISLWGEDTNQLRGISHGDFVMVTNVKTNYYYGTVSLNSTDHTRIVKVHSASTQTVRIEIIGIVHAGKINTELEAGINQQVQTFVVASSSLGKAFGVRLEGDFEERLLDKMPLSADAEIQGNQIIKIGAAKEI